MTQNNIGLALWRLGQRENSTAKLNEAVEAYGAALLEFRREQVPFVWAQTQENLAWAYGAFFDVTREPRYLDHALQAVDGALEEYRKAKAAYDIGTAESLRENILAARGKS